MKEKLVTWLSLFTSAGTLVCCALPALFVALGAGAAFAGLVSTIPQLVWISEHKNSVFIVAGILLIVAGWMQYQARFLPCPTDPTLAAACTRSRKISNVIYWVAIGFYAIGGFFGFLAVYFF